MGNLNIKDFGVKGIAAQIQKGIERGRIDTALNMLEKGYSVEDVEDITGVSKQKLHLFLEEGREG